MALAIPFTMMAQKITLGSCKTHDNGQYKGQMQAGKPHGKGNTLFENGDTYEGEYVKGKRQGQGIYTFSDGEKYDGEWFQDQQHGYGTFWFMNNNRYEGMWYRDYQQGHGVMYYYNGDKYDGYCSRTSVRARASIPLRAALFMTATGRMIRKAEKASLLGETAPRTTVCG